MFGTTAPTVVATVGATVGATVAATVGARVGNEGNVVAAATVVACRPVKVLVLKNDFLENPKLSHLLNRVKHHCYRLASVVDYQEN